MDFAAFAPWYEFLPTGCNINYPVLSHSKTPSTFDVVSVSTGLRKLIYGMKGLLYNHTPWDMTQLCTLVNKALCDKSALSMAWGWFFYLSDMLAISNWLVQHLMTCGAGRSRNAYHLRTMSATQTVKKSLCDGTPIEYR